MERFGNDHFSYLLIKKFKGVEYSMYGNIYFLYCFPKLENPENSGVHQPFMAIHFFLSFPQIEKILKCLEFINHLYF